MPVRPRVRWFSHSLVCSSRPSVRPPVRSSSHLFTHLFVRPYVRLLPPYVCSFELVPALVAFVCYAAAISTDGDEGLVYHFRHKRASPLVQNQSPNLREHREMM